MRLVSLRIYKKNNNETIRDISFNERGLSLICDEEGDEHHFSGSSIGKTAFVKCIDICLGSSSTSSIYSGSGIGHNDELKKYIISNKISLQLKVKSDNGNIYLLERHLFDNKEYINNNMFSNYLEYNKELMSFFFPNCPSNVTFRNIIPKFIRIDSEDAFKYIKSYGRKETYYYVYNYLLNLYIDIDESSLLIEREELNKKNRKIQNQYKIKNNDDFESKVAHENAILIERRNAVVNNDYVKQYSNCDDDNAKLIFELDELTEKLYSKQFKRKIIEDNIKKEESKFVKMDNEVLKLLYGDAIEIFGVYLKDYNDFIGFHNKMCSLRKEGYIEEHRLLSNEILEIENEIALLREGFNKKFVEYKLMVNDASNSLYDQYYDYKQKYETMIKKHNEYESNHQRIYEINALLSNIDIRKNSNEDNKNRFANMLKEKCKILLDEEIKVKFKSSPNNMPMEIPGLGGKFGTGDIKSLICAFDFALYDFFVDKALNMPKFVIHDKMENVSLDKLRVIFDEARKSGVQYILPILHDRIGNLNVNKNEIILSLSKEEKLFKL